MLSGIRKGKRKRKAPPPSEVGRDGSPLKPSVAQDSTGSRLPEPKVAHASDNNRSVAEELRKSLQQSQKPTLTESQSQSLLYDKQNSRKINDGDKDSHDVIVLGKDSLVGATLPKEEDMTIAQMAAHERQTSQAAMDEQFVRSMAHQKNYKLGKTGDDSDEEDAKMAQHLHLMRKGPSDRSAKDRAVAQHMRQENITKKCSWWMQSSGFQKHRLIALGNHVSLSMAPPNLSLTMGHHFYLVPIQHAESFVSCDENVWEELYRFQSSLRQLYQQQKKGVIFCETVFSASKSSGLWQTRIEAIPVPERVAQEAPLFFKSALDEQAEEWGTHSHKLLKIKSTGGLKATIPSKHFAYFWVEWEHNKGFVQILESSQFPKHFGVDTVSSMMEGDPLRFQKHKQVPFDEERQAIVSFCNAWKKYDWTLALDEG